MSIKPTQERRLLEHIKSKGNVKPFEYCGIEVSKLNKQEMINLLAYILEMDLDFTFEYYNPHSNPFKPKLVKGKYDL